MDVSPQVSIIGFYSESPGLSTPRSITNCPNRDYVEEVFSPSFEPGVTGRNVVVRDSKCRIVAGFMQHHRVTVAKFFSWLDLVLDEGSNGILFFSTLSGSVYVPCDYRDPLKRSSQCVLPTGDYLLLNPDESPCKVVLSSRTYLPRLRTQNTTPSAESRDFTSRVVGRDRQCCLSGKAVYPGHEPSSLFQAAHVYPTAWRESWLDKGYANLVGDDIAFGPMNSGFNGLTMTAEFHLLFCYYNVTIDPENFLLIDFTQPGTLYRPMLGHLVLDTYDGDISLLRALLQEHYENSILLNVRGNGIYGDPQSAKAQDMAMLEPYNIHLDDPLFQSGPGKQFLEATLATRLYSRLEGIMPWPRSDNKGKYDTRSQCLSRTPSPFDSPDWMDHVHKGLARLDRQLLIQQHYDTRPFRPLWE